MKKIYFLLLFLFLDHSMATTHYSLENNSTNFVINEFSICKRLTNHGLNSYFVPTGMHGDWANFLNHLPSDVSSSACNLYDWSVGDWSACTGGAGYWIYDDWETCSGGTSNYNYGPWGSCSNGCGDGTQTRIATCSWNVNTGTQVRNATCNITMTGNKSRSVTCKRNDGVIVPDAFCTDTRPVGILNCTPETSSVCTSPSTIRTCTPSGLASCLETAITSMSCHSSSCCSFEYKCPTGVPWMSTYDDYLGCWLASSYTDWQLSGTGDESVCTQYNYIEISSGGCSSGVFNPPQPISSQPATKVCH